MKVTEKSLKARCTELNMGPLRNTTFGIKATRLNAGYTVELQYRDATPPQILAEAVTAAEAAATEGAAAGAAAVQVAGLDKPEFVTRDTFIRQAAERCPKCATKDIFSGHISVDSREVIAEFIPKAIERVRTCLPSSHLFEFTWEPASF